MCSALGTKRPPVCNAARASFNVSRIAFVEAARPKRSMRVPAAGVFRTVSTGGRLRRRVDFIPERQFSGPQRRQQTREQWSRRPHMSEISRNLMLRVRSVTICPGRTDVIWCRLRDSNPRPTVYKTVALPAELNRRRARQWASSEGAPAQGRASGGAGGDRRPPGTVDGHRLAFAGPRRHGDRDERKRRAGLGAKLKRRSERDGERRARAQRLDSLQTFLPTPDAAPPAHDKPDFLNGSMGHRMRDGAGRQFEMRHAAAAKAQQQAHGGSVRRRRVRRSA